MRWLFLFAGLLLRAPFNFAQHIAPTEAKTPAEELKTFKVPDGFEVQLVAAEPQIGKPIQISFDHLGRLWVATSRHYPFPAPPGTAPSDKVFVLSDFAENGLAKKVTTFADNLNIPIGVLPLPDGESCLVSHVGSIVKITPNKQPETILTGFGSRDTHGMMNSFVLLPDGWVYACHGYNNESVIKAKDGSEIRMRSGNTFRFRPDGSRVEPWTFGQVNPFGMTVDPFLNLYTADCHTKPITQLIRHSYYDSFGAPHDGLGYGPHATKHDHGSTALCGLAWYQANHFPKEWNGSLFLGNVVTNRINADKIEWKGGSPIAREMKDFLVSSDPWFRPTDIKLGPDGALYFADFYNRIIGHYEVDLKHPLRDKDRGRIWRIVWKGPGATPPTMPKENAARIELEKLIHRLYDDNLTVRLHAANELATRMKNNSPQLPNLTDLPVRDLDKVTTLYGLVAMAGEQATTPPVDLATYENIVKGIKNDVNQNPDQFTGMTIRAIGSRESWGQKEREIIKIVLDDLHAAPHILRAALDGIIGHPHAEFIPNLLKVNDAINGEDVNTKHALKIALRNCLKQDGAWDRTKGLPEEQFNLVARAALGVHQPAAVQFLLNFLEQSDLQPQMCEHVGRYGTDQQATDFLKILEGKKAKLPATLEAIGSLSKGLQARAGKLPEASKPMAAKLCEAGLNASDPQAIQTALELIGAQRFTQLSNSVTKLIERNDRNEVQRVAALNALINLNNTEGIALAAKMLGDTGLSLSLRERVAIQLGSLSQASARTTLVNALGAAPARLANGIGLALANSPAGSDALLDLIQQGKASPRLLQEKAILAKLQSHNGGSRRPRVAELTKGLPSADAKLEVTMRERLAAFNKAKPDTVVGKQLFTTKCGICHQMANEGAKVGPNLDGIGIRGPERLLEDILDPNRNIDTAFRATIVNLADGRTFIGQLVRDEGEVSILVDAMGKEQRLNKADIEKKMTSPLSVMPANFHEMPETELVNLLGYLIQNVKK